MLVWLSFADPNKPRGSQFLGACVVSIPDDHNTAPAAFMAAIQEAFKQGCNPGGEVRGVPVDPTQWPDKDRNRLLSKQEIEERDLGYSTTQNKT